MPMKVRYTCVDGEVLSENRNGVERFYVPDPLGSTVALLDNTQTKTDTFSYWPYGEERTRTGTTPTPFRFGGTRGYYRAPGSRVYARARVQDGRVGRWLMPDPLGPPLTGPNPYLYTTDSPVTLIDPSGRFSLLEALVVIIVVAVVVVVVVGASGCKPHGRPTRITPPTRPPTTPPGGLPTQPPPVPLQPGPGPAPGEPDPCQPWIDAGYLDCNILCAAVRDNREVEWSQVLACCGEAHGAPAGMPMPGLPNLPTLPASELGCAKFFCTRIRTHSSGRIECQNVPF